MALEQHDTDLTLILANVNMSRAMSTSKYLISVLDITLFKSITLLCGTKCRNILYVEYC